MEAVKKFDPYRGIRFPSYAVWWMRAYIIRYLINNWRVVKLGTTQAQRKLFFNLQKEKERLEAEGIVAGAEAHRAAARRQGVGSHRDAAALGVARSLGRSAAATTTTASRCSTSSRAAPRPPSSKVADAEFRTGGRRAIREFGDT